MIKCRGNLIVSLLLGWFSVAALAQDSDEATPEWWFDVEVIVFDRGVQLTEIAEQFEFSNDFSPIASDVDLITQARKPNIDWVYQNLQPCVSTPPPQLDPIPLPPMELPNHIIELATQPLMSMENVVDEAPIARTLLQSRFNDLVPQSEQTEDIEDEIESVSSTWLDFHAPEFASDTPAYYTPQFTLGCFSKDAVYDTRAFAAEDVLPVYPFGVSRDETWGNHILAKDDLVLDDLSLRIRSERGLTRLMHVAWRQQVKFGKENASTFRVYGGQNYGLAFDENGQLKIPSVSVSDEETTSDSLFDFDTFSSTTSRTENDIVKRVEQRLGVALGGEDSDIITTDNVDTEIWQFDGTIKVFLQYVGRVPYLFIDGDIGYRQPISLDLTDPSKQVLVSIPYKQQRRVISTQLHYFDHPMFGMLIEIRRFKVP